MHHIIVSSTDPYILFKTFLSKVYFVELEEDAQVRRGKGQYKKKL
jgi:hypothetical protein